MIVPAPILLLQACKCNSCQANLRLFVTWWSYYGVLYISEIQNEIMPGQVWWNNIGVVPGDVIVAKIVSDDHQDVWSRCGSDVEECREIEDRGKAWNHIKISLVPSRKNWIPIAYALSRSLLKVLDLHLWQTLMCLLQLHWHSSQTGSVGKSTNQMSEGIGLCPKVNSNRMDSR